MPPGADAHGGPVDGADVRSPPRRVAQRGSSRTVFREGFHSCGPGDPSTPANVPNAAARHPIPRPPHRFRRSCGGPAGPPAQGRRIAGVSDLDRAAVLDALDAVYRNVTAVTGGLGEADLMRPSRCAGWAVADVLYHELLDARRALRTFASP